MARFRGNDSRAVSPATFPEQFQPASGTGEGSLVDAYELAMERLGCLSEAEAFLAAPP